MYPRPSSPSYRRRRVFQLLGVLICSGLMTTLWLMVQLMRRDLIDSSTEINIYVNDDGVQPPQQYQKPYYQSHQQHQHQKRQPTTKDHYFLDGTIDLNNYNLLPKSLTSSNDSNNNNNIPLSNNNSFPPLPPPLDYLGVLIDAGRHYFPLPWLYQHLRHLHNMGYNYIHFRLTDDQNFVLNLTIPSSNDGNDGTSLAFVARHNQEVLLKTDGNSNNGEHKGVYQPHELLEFVKFAKYNYNITVIPEVNVPGHAGAWGANKGYPDIVISCPEFVCSKGYGVPLNVTHIELPRILKYVLKEVIEIFDYPPYLHLGGDELHMSTPCLDEAGIPDPSSWLSETVPYFEENILRPIVEELGYGPHQILRWETRQSHKQRQFGGITHYWESTPSSPKTSDKDNVDGVQRISQGDNVHKSYYDPYVASTGLYLDRVKTDRMYGYGDYLATRHLVTHSNPPFAIIVGTFELNMEFWKDRNVLGRLLAIRMGVSTSNTITIASMDEQQRRMQQENDYDGRKIDHHELVVDLTFPRTSQEFRVQYIKTCNTIFDSSKYDAMCQKAGWPLLDDRNYRSKWSVVWKEWKDGLCRGLTYPEQTIHIKKSTVDAVLQRKTNYFYWDNILSSPASLNSVPSNSVARSLHRNDTITTSNMSIIPNVGILIDLVQNPLSLQEFRELLQKVRHLSFNLIQLRFADDFGQMIEYDSIPKIGYHYSSSKTDTSNGKTPFTYYSRYHLEQMVELAYQVGIQIVPEINLATNGGGWYKTGLLIDCPVTLCSSMRQGIAFDVIDKIESVMPIVLAAILELRNIFSLSSPSSNKFLHLGSDQREVAAQGCFLEAGHTGPVSLAALNHFESKLMSALAMMGIDQNQIIRWHNQENIQYQNRTGKITHYTDIADIVDNESSSIFATVKIANKMTPWEVYQATRSWVQISPTPKGVVAQVINGQKLRLAQLVAFTMGVGRTKSEFIPTTEDEFQRDFDALCDQLHCADKEPVIVVAADNPLRRTTVSLMESCVERTRNLTTKRSRASLLPRNH